MLPTRVQLAGIPIEIVLDPGFVKKHKAIGQSLYLQQQIIIDPYAGGPEVTKQALLHELVHWILFIMHRHTLRDDEQFVDNFAHLLFQALESMERSIMEEGQNEEGS